MTQHHPWSKIKYVAAGGAAGCGIGASFFIDVASVRGTGRLLSRWDALICCWRARINMFHM
jgi:hypothetical protein